MRNTKGNIENASARPWRVEYVTKQKAAYIKGADDSVVAVCHADNAEKIVAAVNAIEKVAMRLRVLSRDGMKPEQAAWIDETQRIAQEAAK